MAIRPEDKDLARILVANSYLHRKPHEEPFVLTSGRTSYHYFDCKLTTSYAQALPLLAAAFWRHLDPEVSGVGGLTRGADPIADAIAYYSATSGGRPVNSFSVRKEKKGHGTERWVEGCSKAGEKVAVVDDVITSGMSVIKAIDGCEAADFQIRQVLVLVDREEGGLAKIRERVAGRVPVTAIFTKTDLDRVWRELHPGEE